MHTFHGYYISITTAFGIAFKLKIFKGKQILDAIYKVDIYHVKINNNLMIEPASIN